MTTRLTTLFLTAALAAPGVAAAKPGDRDFGHTFPAAARLCQKVADGHVPHRFADGATQVTTACDQLHIGYDAAVAAAPDVDALKQAVADAKTSVQSACAGEDRSACRDALKAARTSLRSARQAHREAVRGYHAAIRDARKAFWTTVKGLVGTPAEPTVD